MQKAMNEQPSLRVARNNAKPKSPFQLSLRRFMKNKLAVIGVICLILIILATVFAPLLTKFDPERGDLLMVDSAPGNGHLLGTDSSGHAP